MEVFPGIHLNDTVNFEVYPTSILGNDFKLIKVLAVLDVATASTFIDPYALHGAIYPTLPAGVPNDPAQYNYLKIELPSGQSTAIGIPWIDESSIEAIKKSTLIITVEDVAPEDVNRIVLALSSNGFAAADVKIV